MPILQAKNSKSFLASHNNLSFFHILLIGLLLRILLIPFFGHIDVLSEARRVYFWTENDIFFNTIARNTSMIIQTLFYKVTHIFIPDNHSMFFIEDITKATASQPHSFEFVSHYTIFRTLFVIKLPFLCFDLLTAMVLFFYHDRTQAALHSCKIWLFNPVTIFAFYIFGRFESIPIFFIAAAILAAKHKRFIIAALLVGLSVNGREMMILYAPVFMIAIFAEPLKNISLTKKTIAILLSFLAIIMVTQLYMAVFSDLQSVSTGAKVGSIVKEKRVHHLFAFSIHSLKVLPLVYTLICVWVWNSTSTIDRKLLFGCGLAMMSFFAFSSHTAHFTSWMVVFPAFFAGLNKNITRPFIAFCLVWFFYWCFLTDLGVFTHWLASAYSLHVLGIPTIPHYFKSLIGSIGPFDLKMIIYLLRSCFVATVLYMAFQMIKYMNNNENS